MRKISIVLLFIITSFTLVGCGTDNGEVSQIEEDAIVTNMSQLPIDMTNLQSSNVSLQQPVFLSTSLQSYYEEFSADVEGIKISSDLNYVFTGLNENGASIYNNYENNTSFIKTYIDGGVQVLYEMSDKNSPKEFQLDLELHEGSRLSMTEYGDYVVMDSFGDISAFLGQPWAVDNNGDFIETYYELQDSGIKQFIVYNGDDYPLKADPLFCTNTIDNPATIWNQANYDNRGSIQVYPNTCAKVYLAAMMLSPAYLLYNSASSLLGGNSLVNDMYEELQFDSAYTGHVESWQEGRILDQFLCHAYNPMVQLKQKYPWNLEPWRPDLSLADTYIEQCNPE